MFYRHGDVLFERLEAIPEIHNPRTTDEESAALFNLARAPGMLTSLKI